MKTFKWKAWLAILFILTISILELNWAWGILFLIWVIPDIISGRTHLMEEVRRKDHPITYWSIIILWLFLSVYILGYEAYLMTR